MKHSHEPTPAYSSEIAPEATDYDDGVAEYIRAQALAGGKHEGGLAIETTTLGRHARLSKELLRRATAAVLITTAALSGGIAANEISHGLNRETAGVAQLDIFTEAEALRAGYDIAHGYEKANGGGCKIIRVEDLAAMPGEMPPALGDRTSLVVTFEMTLSKAATEAIATYDNSLTSEGNLLTTRPALNAYTLEKGSSDKQPALVYPGQIEATGEFKLENTDHISFVDNDEMVGAQHNQDGTSTYVSQRTIYPISASAPGNHEPLRFEVDSVSIMDASMEVKSGCDNSLVARDGIWTIGK